MSIAARTIVLVVVVTGFAAVLAFVLGIYVSPAPPPTTCEVLLQECERALLLKGKP